MSHVRNLLHKFAGNTVDPSPIAMTGAAVIDRELKPSSSADIGELKLDIVAQPSLAGVQVVEARLRPENRLIFHEEPHSKAADRFRYLRMRLRDLWNNKKLKKLVVTSPLAHDGKSTVLLNLATALCERGKRTVVVVEADLHHSTITETLQLSPWLGLSDCLEDESTSLLSAIRRVEPLGWHLLPAGEPRRNPTELLQSPMLGRIIGRLAEQFDWVLIDSPPVVPLTDALSLQQHADGSLLVVRAGRTPRTAVEEAVTLLNKKNIFGIVLNAVELSSSANYQYQYGREV